MLTKFNINQIILAAALSGILVLITGVIYLNQVPIPLYFASLAALILFQHYILNVLHIASHRGAGKRKKLNNLIGHWCALIVGFQFDVFRTTHIQHHAFPNDPKKDPDYTISNTGQLWWIAFRVPFHDYFFFQQEFHKREHNLRNYIIVRAIQIVFLATVVATGVLDIFIFYWLLPLFITGNLYGLFQFYFPHYSTPTIDNWRKSRSLNVVQQFVLFCVDISGYYHFKHHQQINNNTYYFPFYAYWQDRLAKRPLRENVTDLKYLEYRQV